LPPTEGFFSPSQEPSQDLPGLFNTPQIGPVIAPKTAPNKPLWGAWKVSQRAPYRLLLLGFITGCKTFPKYFLLFSIKTKAGSYYPKLPLLWAFYPTP